MKQADPNRKRGVFLMKTAAVKTSIWKDKKIRSMHIDTKLVFLCLITNPERSTTRYMQADEDYLCIQSGIDFRQLEVIKKQLSELGVVFFVDDWVIFADDSYVQPHKGRLSQTLYEKDLATVPQKVIDFYNNSSDLFMNDSCASHECISKGNSISNSKDISNNSKPEINELFSLWNEVVGYEIDSNKQKNRYACSNLLKKHGKDKVEQLLRGVAMSQSDKYAPRISDFVSLQSKLSELLAWGKRQSSTNVKGVIKI